jgi:hypothetical protein
MKGPMGRIPTYQSLEGLDRTSSPTGTQYPVPRRHHLPGDSSREDTPPRELLKSPCTRHRYSTRGAPRSHSPGKTCLNDSSQILSSRHDPHHSHPQLTPRSPQLLPSSVTSNIIIISAPRALATHKQSSTKHHIISIMRSRSSMRVTSNHISASLAYQRVCRRVVATR